jgi:probable blue pigment (indigoidine) exporter
MRQPGHSAPTSAGSIGDRLLTAIAPLVWGSTYLVSTTFLPRGHPLTIACLRALPAALLLLAIVRELPTGDWWWRSAILGLLNIGFFWAMLFVAAFRLPGGVAATVIASQPLIVVLLMKYALREALPSTALLGATTGIAGVALLVLTPSARLDGLGIAAAVAGAISMALGTLLTQRWKAPVGPLTLAAWQLCAGGLSLIPAALLCEPAPLRLTSAGFAALAYLGLVGAAAAFAIWFRGLRRLDAGVVSGLVLLSPASATLLGWAVAGERLQLAQLAGLMLTLFGVWLSQRRSSQPA